MVDESFSSNDISAGIIPELSDKCRNVSQSLLNYYVRVEGLKISQVKGDRFDRLIVLHATHLTSTKPYNLITRLQMMRKSVETRDWLNSIEPRNVRAVMKRVVEDITAIDSQVILSR